MAAGWRPAQRQRLVQAETFRAGDLAAVGTLKRLWKIPGRWASWGLRAAGDATELHAATNWLALYPWLDVEVHPLAKHPSDPTEYS